MTAATQQHISIGQSTRAKLVEARYRPCRKQQYVWCTRELMPHRARGRELTSHSCLAEMFPAETLMLLALRTTACLHSGQNTQLDLDCASTQ